MRDPDNLTASSHYVSVRTLDTKASDGQPRIGRVIDMATGNYIPLDFIPTLSDGYMLSDIITVAPTQKGDPNQKIEHSVLSLIELSAMDC